MVYHLKEGDIVSVSVKNTNTTMSQQLSGGTSTGLTGTIAGEASGIVTANGN